MQDMRGQQGWRRDLEERKRLESKIFKWEWKKQYE